MSATPALVATDLSISFGGVHAVQGISLAVDSGEVLGVIGPNGAGKSTLVNLLTGYLKPRAGRMAAMGRDYTGLPPHRIWKRGVVRSFQAAASFASATVAESLEIAIDAGRHGSSIGAMFAGMTRTRRSPDVARLLAEHGLAEVANARPASLPYGRQKILGMAIGVAASPRVLLLDEPVAGLTHGEALVVGQQITRIAAGGVAIIVIDHNVRFMAAICARLLVMSYGKQIAMGPTAETLADPAVIAAYLGDLDV
jgi:branched-chain amino acid transport system ATP-binding protein